MALFDFKLLSFLSGADFLRKGSHVSFARFVLQVKPAPPPAYSFLISFRKPTVGLS